jgi:hypothetical protein
MAIRWCRLFVVSEPKSGLPAHALNALMARKVAGKVVLTPEA